MTSRIDKTKAPNPRATERRVSRQDHDWFPTPEWATRALLAREYFPPRIWEPACGDGAMSRVLEAAGYQVTSTDLIDRGYGQARQDFLLTWRPILADEAVVTNPPFSLATQFVEHALAMGARKVAMLCRVAFLEGQERGLGIHRGLSRVWVFSRRVTMYRGDVPEADQKGGGSMAFAWFVWEASHRGPQIGFIAE